MQCTHARKPLVWLGVAAADPQGRFSQSPRIPRARRRATRSSGAPGTNFEALPGALQFNLRANETSLHYQRPAIG
eukprot:14209056-Alexandrium_andersonii.AAC.1